VIPARDPPRAHPQQRDPFEYGRRGRWTSAHWSRTSWTDVRLCDLDGEAVATGVLLDSIYAAKKSVAHQGRTGGDSPRVRAQRLSTCGSKNSTGARRTAAHDFGGLRDFQEHLGGELTVTFPRGLARGTKFTKSILP